MLHYVVVGAKIVQVSEIRCVDGICVYTLPRGTVTRQCVVQDVFKSRIEAIEKAIENAERLQKIHIKRLIKAREAAIRYQNYIQAYHKELGI